MTYTIKIGVDDAIAFYTRVNKVARKLGIELQVKYNDGRLIIARDEVKRSK